MGPRGHGPQVIISGRQEAPFMRRMAITYKTGKGHNAINISRADDTISKHRQERRSFLR